MVLYQLRATYLLVSLHVYDLHIVAEFLLFFIIEQPKYINVHAQNVVLKLVHHSEIVDVCKICPREFGNVC